MFDAAHIAGNGVSVQYIDMGVEYSYGSKTLEIVGDYAEGELSMSDGDHVIGYYERGDDGVTVVTLEDGKQLTATTEEEYEELALKLLTE